MANTAVKLPVKNEASTDVRQSRPSFHQLRRQVERLFNDFDRDPFAVPASFAEFGLEPLWRGDVSVIEAPAVDIAEKDNAYEITAELPGLSEKNVEVGIANGVLSIKGEKTEEKDEKRKGYHLSERRFGSFERSFLIPDGVDAGKVEATFKNGVLSVVLPKTEAAKKAEQKIPVKAA